MPPKLDTQIALILQRLDQLEGRVVSKEEFEPIRKIVYSGVALILSAVGAAGIALVLQK